jgi:hypothetical protein
VIVSVPAFPAASRATTTIVLSPAARAIDATLQEVVPEAVPFAAVVRFVHTTVVTPTLSEAVPARASGVEAVAYVGEEVGVVIVHTGEVVS